jgi:hypothetical protein
MNAFLIDGCSSTFEIYHTFKGLITCLYVLILSSILLEGNAYKYTRLPHNLLLDQSPN